MRDLYKILGLITTISAAAKGIDRLFGNLARRQAHKTLARTMRKF